MKRLAAVLGVLLFISPAVFAQDDEEAASPRNRTPLTILQINDVYAPLPTDGQGGLARVATVKQQLATEGRAPLLVIAGDFLGPSVASSVFKGEQMVATLNAAGVDIATFGNHEFDFGKDVLLKRMAESRFQWVASNVLDTTTGKPLGGAAPYLIRTFGNLKVGFIGLCLRTSQIAKDKLEGIRIVDPMQAAATYLPVLRRNGVNVIVAVTHLSFAEDRALVDKFPQIDLIIGGHEHFPIAVTQNRTLISKAGADAKWVARIDVSLHASGRVDRFYELLPVTSAIADDARTAEVIKSYEDRLGKELETVVGASSVDLDAVAVRIRAAESGLGNLVADALRADTNADAAIVNSGSIRGDRVYPAGPITRRTLVAIHPFGNVVCMLALPGRVILQALESGVSRLPAATGQFPQVSGLTMTVDRSAAIGRRVRDVKVDGQPLDPNKTYRVAIPDFMMKGGDNYDMFAGQTILVGPESGDLMADALEKYVAAKGTITPAIEGRIKMN